MAHDDIPEDCEESYPCECGGSITWNYENRRWECGESGCPCMADLIEQQQTPSEQALLQIAAKEG